MRFKIKKCENHIVQDQNNNEYESPVLILNSFLDGSVVSLYFPVVLSVAKMIYYIFAMKNNKTDEDNDDTDEDYDGDYDNNDETYKENEKEFECSEYEKSVFHNNIITYQTMESIWLENGLFLSGFFIESSYSEELKIDIFNVYMILSNNITGHISSFIKTSFQNALFISALFDIDLIIGDDLLKKNAPEVFNQEFNDEDIEKDKNNNFIKNKSNEFPVDSDLLNIAKKIFNKQSDVETNQFLNDNNEK